MKSKTSERLKIHPLKILQDELNKKYFDKNDRF